MPLDPVAALRPSLVQPLDADVSASANEFGAGSPYLHEEDVSASRASFWLQKFFAADHQSISSQERQGMAREYAFAVGWFARETANLRGTTVDGQVKVRLFEQQAEALRQRLNDPSLTVDEEKKLVAQLREMQKGISATADVATEAQRGEKEGALVQVARDRYSAARDDHDPALKTHEAAMYSQEVGVYAEHLFESTGVGGFKVAAERAHAWAADIRKLPLDASADQRNAMFEKFEMDIADVHYLMAAMKQWASH